MKTYTLDQAEDLLIGKKGTEERNEYEFELKLELIGDMIKTARKKRKLTQEQLGELVGVKKPIQNQLNSLFFDYEQHSDAVEYKPAPYYLFRMFVRSAFFVSLVNLVFYFNAFSFVEFVVMNAFLFPLTIFLVLIKYKKTYFTFQEEILVVGDGKISTVTTVMPYFKTQNILFQQSIIQKKRGVATLKFQTASGVIKLPCLRLEDALNIQQKVLIEVENSKRDWI